MCTIFYRKSRRMEGAPVSVGKPDSTVSLNIVSQLGWWGSGTCANRPPSPPGFLPLSQHLAAAPAHVASYTLPSVDGEQITSHIKGLLSVHRLTHTCTNTHSRTQDNRASAGARVRVGGVGAGVGFRELRVEEGWGSMALPHTKAALK